MRRVFRGNKAHQQNDCDDLRDCRRVVDFRFGWMVHFLAPKIAEINAANKPVEVGATGAA